jgi:Tat protein secretion system quality control protein TatD with DNase activity
VSSSYAGHKQLLDQILPDLPGPISIRPLIEEMRQHAVQAQKRGSLVMIGEVGLDKSFRVPFPGHKANHCGEHAEEGPPSIAEAETAIAASEEDEVAKATGQFEAVKRTKSLTPFRPSIDHQIRILKLQMDLAVELGINVSLHSVKAQGPTLDFLRSFKKEHGTMFTDRVNVDVHSCGGWSVESWVDAEVCSRSSTIN